MEIKELINKDNKSDIKLKDIQKEISEMDHALNINFIMLVAIGLLSICNIILIFTNGSRVTEIDRRIEVRECIKLEGSLFCGTDEDYE